jgi:acyl-CoA synthetase (AMP-forming)/AMP-acid ligase II
VSPFSRLADAARAAAVIGRTGALHPEPPGRMLRMAAAARHWGQSLATVFAISAARYDTRVAIVDERGPLTFAELERRTSALARGLAARGVRGGDTVGVLCRNSRYFFDVTGALAKLGVNALFLNTGFSAPQLRDVMHRERSTFLMHDDEFTRVAADAGATTTLLAWSDARSDIAQIPQSIDDLIVRHAEGPQPLRPEREGRTIILTSGTTGTPKGALQGHAADPMSGLGLLERLPYRARETTVITAPVFHSWGFTNAIVSLLLGDTMVLDRRFDPERTLALIARHRAQVLAAVPVMLLRILELPADVCARHDTSSLRFVPLSGSALPGDLATRFMDQFGDVLYNLYGSTEVGAVSVASPADLRAAPSTAGRPPRGISVRLLDESNREVERGATGRIFVRGPLAFDGYTDGASRAVVDGYMHTGDTGHFDEHGRLFVDGRDDDMIVSGGENVFPAEVEDVIARHPDVVEAAVVGVADPEFGQRLKAFVVRRADATLGADDVCAHVRANLARYKVPRDVEFVTELPRNATGKVLRRSLG